MPRQTFERKLRQLEDQVLSLGSMVSQALIDSVLVLKKRDRNGALQLIAGDRAINARRFEIESECLTLIATQQPMAGDLRSIAAMLEIVTELERIGDYAKGIANISLMIGNSPLGDPINAIMEMAEIARDMLQRALQVFVNRDAALAHTIPLDDDKVDQLYIKVYRAVIGQILANSTSETIERANYILWAAHNLERTADRVTNICERVIFTVTGEMDELDEETTGIIAGLQ